MSLVLHYNGRDFVNQVTGEVLTNNGVVHKRTEKGMSALIKPTQSISITGVNIDVVDMVSWIGGIGTCRIVVGVINTDIAVTEWTNTRTILNLFGQSSITITCLSGFIFVKNISLYDESLTTYQLNKLQEDFLNIPILGETKYHHNPDSDLYFTEDFRYQGDGNVAHEHIKGTGIYEVATIDNTLVDPVLNINAGDKYYKCITGGTETIHLKLSDYVGNGYIESLLYFNGTSWSQVGGDTFDNVVAAQSWLNYLNNKLTFNLTSGQAYTNLIIRIQ